MKRLNLSSAVTSSRSFKLAILLVLLAQNTMHVLLIRYSRGERKEQYNKTSLVLLTEITKLCFHSFDYQHAITVQFSAIIFHFSFYLSTLAFCVLTVICVFMIIKDKPEQSVGHFVVSFIQQVYRALL